MTSIIRHEHGMAGSTEMKIISLYCLRSQCEPKLCTEVYERDVSAQSN